MADISKITLPNGQNYNIKDSTARNAANSAVPNTRTVNGKALSSDISLGAGDVGLGSVANLDQSKAIKSITRNGTTFTATALDGTTSTFTQQDTITIYDLASQSSKGLMSAADKAKLDGITGQVTADKFNAPDHTTDLVQYGAVQIAAQQIISMIPDYNYATSEAGGLMSAVDKAKLDGIGAGSNVKSVNGKTGAVTLAKGDVGLGSVANLDQSKAIKSITRSGTTFTATALDGTTTTFTQQESLNHVVASKTQPSNQQAGDIWLIIK